ncbi:MAG: hypothetical protein ABSB35_23035 [Bryobacteraceae bacterium]|jgi:hypothetical protein
MRDFLIPETIATEDGIGKVLTLGGRRGKPLLLNLEITQIIQQESLDISIWGSGNEQHWRQLVTFPQKSYCGSYLAQLDLACHEEIRYLRAQWRLSRWGEGEPAVLAGFNLSIETQKKLHTKPELPLALRAVAS